jgi:hypothetical protein
MHYIVNSRGEVVGTASGAVNTEDLSSLGSIAIYSDLNLTPSEVKVTGFPDKPQIVEQPKTVQPLLKLSTTANDDDGDGTPDLKADGNSTATLTVTAQTAAGEKIESAVPVTFRTTAGRLAARTVTLEDGTASVQFTAGRDTILAHITASAVGFDSADLAIELVP